MELKKFVNALVRVPCQIVRTGRRIVYRLLGWNPWLGVLLRAADVPRRAGVLTPTPRSRGTDAPIRRGRVEV